MKQNEIIYNGLEVRNEIIKVQFIKNMEVSANTVNNRKFF